MDEKLGAINTKPNWLKKGIVLENLALGRRRPMNFSLFFYQPIQCFMPLIRLLECT
jgi:hypothetical protein